MQQNKPNPLPRLHPLPPSPKRAANSTIVGARPGRSYINRVPVKRVSNRSTSGSLKALAPALASLPTRVPKTTNMPSAADSPATISGPEIKPAPISNMTEVFQTAKRTSHRITPRPASKRGNVRIPPPNYREKRASIRESLLSLANRDPLSARLRTIEHDFSDALDEAFQLKPHSKDGSNVDTKLQDPFPVFSDLIELNRRKNWFKGFGGFGLKKLGKRFKTF
ncbi:uncharacterized protein VTP21DRAFT_2116 [Calcarisporiella thermophila]|uniref:uncharacterized protein n=1 Tax=Calcarisporiella thermophila TaxID=911321 RepID=UPI0037443CF7